MTTTDVTALKCPGCGAPLDVANEIKPKPAATASARKNRNINTGGGVYIAGAVSVGGDYVGRDKITTIVNNIEGPVGSITSVPPSTETKPTTMVKQYFCGHCQDVVQVTVNL